jgi:hypothetical protein
MRRMNGAQLLFGVVVLGAIGASFVAIGVRAAQMTELPAGPNRELVVRTCATCHDLQMVFDTGGLARSDWEGVVDEMTTYGMNVTLGDRTLIVEYLATYLPPKR